MSSNPEVSVTEVTTRRPKVEGGPLTDAQRAEVMRTVDEATGTRRTDSMVDAAIRRVQEKFGGDDA